MRLSSEAHAGLKRLVESAAPESILEDLADLFEERQSGYSEAIAAAHCVAAVVRIQERLPGHPRQPTPSC